MPNLPAPFQQWFRAKGWALREYQAHMLAFARARQSTLLIAPTGAGKTLSGFLPSLVDLHEQPRTGLHTLYISPLKALTHDIQRNLLEPVEQMGLEITIETRTGDTPAHKRQRQRKKPPNILLTTPESLMLMLSYADADKIFGKLNTIIIDEAHSLAPSKRGDFTALAMARLHALAPNLLRIGLSATVAEPAVLAAWLGPTGEPAQVYHCPSMIKPDIRLLETNVHIPYGGHMATYAVEDIYRIIQTANTSLVFVNTRAQAELLFQNLWEKNTQGLPIAIYHGALSKEQRHKTENMMAQGLIRAVVCTSALELGIDWGNVDLVLQVGAPKGVSRLLQRIGRSNHTLEQPSAAVLVPGNRFEALEALSAMHAIERGEIDAEPIYPGALDIIPQFIMNCACASPVTPDEIYQQCTDASPYSGLERQVFDQLWAFTIDGGYTLRHYDRFHRLVENQAGEFEPTNRRVIARHRQNIGVIVEAGRLRVKRLRRAHSGKIIGEIEEYFAQQLVPGDTFLFAGEVLMFDGIKDMCVEAYPAKAKEPKIPSFVGGNMPLSSFLADAVRQLLNTPETWTLLPEQVRDWLGFQRDFSKIPGPEKVLIEHFPYRQAQYTLIYTFEGRSANQTLGMLITKRMEKQGLQPLSFSITDYGLSICSLKTVSQSQIVSLFHPDILGDELEDWMLSSPMLKRSFRHVAMVSGVTEQQYHGTRKTMKQVTFSTDLIYDTLREHDPDHILLKVTREDAERELLDLQRLAGLLIRYVDKIDFVPLPKASPMAIPIVLNVRSEVIKGSGQQALLEQASLYDEAQSMMAEVRALLAG
ncbi:MAG: ligase-associated DNA damage response DEXH box helicase [Glaciecola sp.]|jgi:ATP-dependent Lhr-like helicase